MKRLQSVSVAIGILCAVLALSASTGHPLVARSDPEHAGIVHPFVILVGAIGGFLTRRRMQEIDRRLWQVVDDSSLTSGEREYAHREAASEKKTAAVTFLVAPLSLGLWLAYQFKGEEFGAAELLTISPLAGFLVGLGAAALWRREDDSRPKS